MEISGKGQFKKAQKFKKNGQRCEKLGSRGKKMCENMHKNVTFGGGCAKLRTNAKRVSSLNSIYPAKMSVAGYAAGLDLE